MDIRCKKISAFLDVTMTHGGTTIYLGLHDLNDAKKLEEELIEALDYVQWYINSVSE